MRLGFAMLLALGLGLTLLSGAYGVDDKEVTIKGQVICAKCGLDKEKTCMTVVLEKKDGKEILYYFDKDSNKKYHKDICQEAKDGSVTGVVSEKDGKKTIAATKVEYAK
jgi:RecG-like helicase